MTLAFCGGSHLLSGLSAGYIHCQQGQITFHSHPSALQLLTERLYALVHPCIKKNSLLVSYTKAVQFFSTLVCLWCKGSRNIRKSIVNSDLCDRQHAELQPYGSLCASRLCCSLDTLWAQSDCEIGSTSWHCSDNIHTHFLKQLNCHFPCWTSLHATHTVTQQHTHLARS